MSETKKTKDVAEVTLSVGKLTVSLRVTGVAHFQCQLYLLVKRMTCFGLKYYPKHLAD